MRNKLLLLRIDWPSLARNMLFVTIKIRQCKQVYCDQRKSMWSLTVRSPIGCRNDPWIPRLYVPSHPDRESLVRPLKNVRIFWRKAWLTTKTQQSNIIVIIGIIIDTSHPRNFGINYFVFLFLSFSRFSFSNAIY